MSSSDRKLAQLKRKRGGHRSHASRQLAVADKLLTDKVTDTFKLRECAFSLERVIDSLSTLNAEIQELVTDTTEWETDIDESEKVGIALGESRGSILAMIADVEFYQSQQQLGVAFGSKVAQQASTGPPPAVSKPSDHMRLPKLEIPKFNGDPLEWMSFWDSFRNAIAENPSVSNALKLKYLKNNLRDEAFDLIRDYREEDAMYQVAVDVLQERYGDPDIAIYGHMKALLATPTASNGFADLRAVTDKCDRHIRSLEALGLSEDTFGVVFTPILMSKLPRDIQLELHRRNGSPKWDFGKMRDLLKSELVARDRSTRYEGFSPTQAHSSPSNSYSTDVAKPKALGKPTDTALAQVSKFPTPQCAFCQERHYSDACPKYKTLPERKQQLKGRCFVCLGKWHSAAQCKRRRSCYYCSSNQHHRSLCPTGNQREQPKSTANGTTNLNVEAREFVPHQDTSLLVNHTDHPVQLQLAATEVSGIKSTRRANLFLDPGSSRSFIRQELNTAIGGKIVGRRTAAMANFGARKRKTTAYDVVEVHVGLQDGSCELLSLCVTDHICCPVEKIPVSGVPQSIRNQLAETIVEKVNMVPIDILIGADLYFSLVTPNSTPLGNDGLVLLSTKFGKVITGPVVQAEGGSDNTLLFASGDPKMEDLMNLERFWSTEELGIKERGTEQESDEAVLAKFMQTVERVEGRYQVKWPLKTDISMLEDNFGLALGRLRSLLRRLQMTPQTLQKYGAIIDEQREKGIIEVAPTIPDGNKTYYVPHHGVETPQKTTTKLRIVYDASSKISKEAQSLNECLYRGPALMTDMGGLLLRFRSHPVAFVSDIEKAYLQVALHKPDRDLVRFLWVKDTYKPPDGENLLVFRFCRVPFGVITSESLLDMVIYAHCSRQGTVTAESVKENHFVDNVIDGRSTVAEAVTYYEEAKRMFDDAKMNLREWYSNSAALMEAIASTDRGVDRETKVLGLSWDTNVDTFSTKQPSTNSSGMQTKRGILKVVASIFDPLGFCSPITVPAKVLLQELWKRKQKWDECLPENVLKTWEKCLAELQNIGTIRLPRQAFNRYDDNATFEIHAFCDASAKAFGAVVFVRSLTSTKADVAMLMSKARVCPAQGLTIPKLELAAAVLGSKLLAYVQTELKLPSANSFLWTDSQCVLWWLRNSVGTPYVQRRVNKIKEVPDLVVSYVPTAENPADILSRGATVEELRENELWFGGPNWLSLTGRESWPDQPEDTKNPPHQLAQEITIMINNNAANRQNPVGEEIIPLNRYATMQKASRVLAYILRFIERLKARLAHRKHNLEIEAEETDCQVSTPELRRAQAILVRHEQRRFWSEQLAPQDKAMKSLNPYRDATGTIRCRGRLHHSALDDNAKWPILLPRKSNLVNLAILDAHLACAHSGVSQTLATLRTLFWVPKGRQQVKQVLRRCARCRRHAGGSYGIPNPPPLPEERVTRAKPFNAIGIDFLGPLYVKVDEVDRKVWVCLFTCAAVRAVHLELVESLSAESFMLALRRFIALRGRPRVIISDNAGTYRLAHKALDRIWDESDVGEGLKGFCVSNGIEWRFIPEYAPWFGGFYERLVGVVKNCLKRSIHGRRLDVVQLQTVIAEASHIVNCRPLTIVSEEAEFCLSPYHLLHGADPDLMPLTEETDDYVPRPNTVHQLIQRWKFVTSILNTFWDVWRSQYLAALREKSFQWKRRGSVGFGPAVGDVVLIGDKSPRQHWKIARVVELEVSRDGNCRSVKVELPNGKELRRPIKMLYPLEASVVEGDGEVPRSNAVAQV